MAHCTLCDDDSEHICGGKSACHPDPGEQSWRAAADRVNLKASEVYAAVTDAIQECVDLGHKKAACAFR
jgi:hypothetical protein